MFAFPLCSFKNILTVQKSLRPSQFKWIERDFRFSCLEWWTEAVVYNYPPALQFHLQPIPTTHRAWDCCGIQFTSRWEIPNENTSLGPTLLCKDQVGSQAFSFYHLMCCSCHKTDHPQESTLIYYISLNYVRKAVGCDRQFEQRRICRKISNLNMSKQTPSLQGVHIWPSHVLLTLESFRFLKTMSINASGLAQIFPDIDISECGNLTQEYVLVRIDFTNKQRRRNVYFYVLDKLCSGNSGEGRITFQLVLIPRLLSQN